MPMNPKTNEQKIERMLNAWETLAPDKSFGGMTLAQFRAAAGPAQAARQRIDELEDQLKQAQTDRDEADEAFLAKPNSSSTASLQMPRKALTAPSTKHSATAARANAAAA